MLSMTKFVIHVSAICISTSLTIPTQSLWANEITEVRASHSGLLEKPEVNELIKYTKKPKYLFHWSRKKANYRFSRRPGATRWYDFFPVYPTTPIRGSNKLKLPPFNDSQFLKFTQNKSVLFFWSHPITGMAINDTEQYAEINEETNKASTLIVAKPKANATYSIYVSRYTGFVPESTTLAANTDFVLHIHTDENGKLRWQEWILQNPDAVEWATKNRSITRQIVESYLTGFHIEEMPFYLFHSLHAKVVPQNYMEIINQSLYRGTRSASFRCQQWLLRN